jgi:stage IV sporulation protein FB
MWYNKTDCHCLPSAARRGICPVLIGEPPRSQADLHFSLFGIPVRAHPFFWLVGVLLTPGGLFDAPDLKVLLSALVPWIVAFFLAILIHELGHALVMRWYGFSPWITLYGLGGLASYNPGQYGSRGSGTAAQVLISAAGPGAGFLLAALVAGVLVLAGAGLDVYLVAGFLPYVRAAGDVGSAAFTSFLNDVLFISIFWGIINLLPVYPLDGGNIARELLLRVNPRAGIRQSLILSIVAGGGMAVVSLVQLGSLLMGLFFGYMAYTSFATLQHYSNRGPW